MIKQGFHLMPIGNGTNIKTEINCMNKTQLPNRCRGEPCSPARMQSIRIARIACKLSIHRFNYIKSYVFNRKFHKAGERGSHLHYNNNIATFIKNEQDKICTITCGRPMNAPTGLVRMIAMLCSGIICFYYHKLYSRTGNGGVLINVVTVC